MCGSRATWAWRNWNRLSWMFSFAIAFYPLDWSDNTNITIEEKRELILSIHLLRRFAVNHGHKTYVRDCSPSEPAAQLRYYNQLLRVFAFGGDEDPSVGKLA